MSEREREMKKIVFLLNLYPYITLLLARPLIYMPLFAIKVSQALVAAAATTAARSDFPLLFIFIRTPEML